MMEEKFGQLLQQLADKPTAVSLVQEIRQAYGVQAREIEDLRARIQKARLDSATGVLTRAAFFEEVHGFLQEVYPVFAETGKFPLRGEKFYIVTGDLAILSFFNGISQLEGDRVLLRSADALRNYFPGQDVGRIGGDEFAVLVRQAEEFAIKAALQDVREEVGSEPPQWIDLDYSTWKDVAHYLTLLGESGKNYFEFMTPRERLKRVANILVGVAAQRAQIAKSYERIENAIRLRASKGKLFYLGYMNHARKGACGITDKELADLIRDNRRNLNNLANSIMLFVLTKKANAASLQSSASEIDYALLHEVAASTYFVAKVEV